MCVREHAAQSLGLCYSSGDEGKIRDECEKPHELPDLKSWTNCRHRKGGVWSSAPWLLCLCFLLPTLFSCFPHPLVSCSILLSRCQLLPLGFCFYLCLFFFFFLWFFHFSPWSTISCVLHLVFSHFRSLHSMFSPHPLNSISSVNLDI